MATLLIVDDSSVYRAMARKAMADVGLFDRIREAPTAESGLQRLNEEPIDLVLCGLEVPEIGSEDLFRIKTAAPGGATTAFVFLTASTDRERRVALLEAGACDVIDKPFHPTELVARIRLHLQVKWLRDELLKKNEALARLSTTDELTGLRNRRFLMESLTTEFHRAKRFRVPLTAMMLDLDHFKKVNDELGHQAGDAVLREVATLLLAQTRATDVVGRYGGEEIMVLLAQTGVGGGRAYGEIVRRRIEQTPIPIPGAKTIHVTVSIGLAGYGPGMKFPADLIAACDAALYRAKEKGRNRVEG